MRSVKLGVVCGVAALGVGAACGGSGESDGGRGFGGTGGSAAAGATGGTGATGGGLTTGGAAGAGNAGSGGTAADGGVGMGCGTAQPCPGGQICAAGMCTPSEGDCNSDVDCGGDTYCCRDGCLTDPSAMPACIPYGTGDRGNQNPDCQATVEIGLFDPAVQCEWTAPPTGDPYPNHVNVLATPLVADLPNDSGAAAEIVIVTYNHTDGGAESAQGSNPAFFGVIRIINGQSCEQLENIDDPANRVIAASPPALGDLDGDGTIEIVTHRAGGGVIAFKWNGSAYQTMWTGPATSNDGFHWDGPSLHDLNDDGFPEVLSDAEVYDGRTGMRLNPGQTLQSHPTKVISVAGDVDGDGNVELVQNAVYRWNRTTNQWDSAYPGAGVGFHYAFADFGTPGATPQDFNPTMMDGVAEVVATGSSSVRLSTLQGQHLIDVTLPGGENGGPPTIGDFDNDGFPEIATAGGTGYRVFDLDCANPTAPGCAGQFLRWTTPSQDSSSARTGSSVFDFEGDGKDEAVYADECFLRIYAGDTGEVLYSAFRTSCTWYENPIVADPDRDQNTEIVVNSNANCGVLCPVSGGAVGVPFVDPIHPGQRCIADVDCVSQAVGSCNMGFCRCANDMECAGGQTCVAPLPATPGVGNVCRATHPNAAGLNGIRVLRDRLDRWASSRTMWNQHAYSVTNVEDDGTIPQTSSWMQNFQQSSLNNYRQNVQGATPPDQFPDITGRLDQDNVCTQSGGAITLTATVCNRGLRAVGADMPATFYRGDPANEDVLCVSFTNGPVPTGGCLEVSCEINEAISGVVSMVVNDDGMGGQTTVECVDLNNTDTVNVSNCGPR